ncbi:hypothetical protein GCM10009754_55600 [Amycolatopsis minnesotensis]|uniref:Uncharacterized protein n=1 Tax=Amycolatopsis minnesotensis TaxID=337894 RepID=A0ABN2RRD0_9PSEU
MLAGPPVNAAFELAHVVGIHRPRLAGITLYLRVREFREPFLRQPGSRTSDHQPMVWCRRHDYLSASGPTQRVAPSRETATACGQSSVQTSGLVRDPFADTAAG